MMEYIDYETLMNNNVRVKHAVITHILEDPEFKKQLLKRIYPEIVDMLIHEQRIQIK